MGLWYVFWKKLSYIGQKCSCQLTKEENNNHAFSLQTFTQNNISISTWSVAVSMLEVRASLSPVI